MWQLLKGAIELYGMYSLLMSNPDAAARRAAREAIVEYRREMSAEILRYERRALAAEQRAVQAEHQLALAEARLTEIEEGLRVVSREANEELEVMLDGPDIEDHLMAVFRAYHEALVEAQAYVEIACCDRRCAPERERAWLDKVKNGLDRIYPQLDTPAKLKSKHRELLSYIDRKHSELERKLRAKGVYEICTTPTYSITWDGMAIPVVNGIPYPAYARPDS